MIYNHRSKIQGVQPAHLKAIYPGMIVQFDYQPTKDKEIKDETPLVLILYKEAGYKAQTGLVHALNLNYLMESEVQRLFCTCELLYKGAGVYSKEPVRRTIQSQMSDYDDTMPYRNLLKEEFTRIMLPTYKEKRDGDPLSQAEAKRQMKMLYEKVIKRLLNRFDIYRTYDSKRMRALKVVKYKLGEWNQPGVKKDEN